MRVENLKKSYGERKVLDGISFEGEEGKVTSNTWRIRVWKIYTIGNTL
jgi:ABC-type histidine transport system ATPase subunit